MTQNYQLILQVSVWFAVDGVLPAIDCSVAGDDVQMYTTFSIVFSDPDNVQ